MNEIQLNKAIKQACENGDIEQLNILFQEPNLFKKSDNNFGRIYINYQDSSIIAVKEGKLEAIKALIENQKVHMDVVLDIHQIDYIKLAAKAAQHGHTEIVKYLFDYCKSINNDILYHDKELIMDSAAIGNNRDLVEHLLNSPYGQDNRRRGGLYYNALHAASNSGNMPILELLANNIQIDNSPDDLKLSLENFLRNCLNDCLTSASRNNQEQVVKYFLTSEKLKEYTNINFKNDTIFNHILLSKNIEFVKYLLTSSDLDTHSNINAKHTLTVDIIYKNNNLDFLDYCLTSPDLETHLFIEPNKLLVVACQDGNFEFVKYLLTAPHLKDKTDIHTIFEDNTNGLTQACKHGHYAIARYLLTSSDLKENANVYFNDGVAFGAALSKDRLNIVKFLAFYFQTDALEKFVKDVGRNGNYTNSSIEYLQSYISSQKELTSLTSEVQITENKTRKIIF